MKKKGSVPLTVAGIIILLTAIFVAGYYQMQSHRVKMRSIEKKSEESASTSVVLGRNELERLAKSSLYDAMWVVGKKAGSYDTSRQRKRSLERLTGLIYKIKLSDLSSKKKDNFTRQRIEWSGKQINVELKARENKYPLLKMEFPEKILIKNRTIDNEFYQTIPIKKLETKVDARFFLLQERMKEFRDQFDKIKRRWMFAEYAKAYAQSWLMGTLDVKSSHSKFLFKLALVSHELEKFGSTDYLNILKSAIDDEFDLDDFENNINTEIPKEELENFRKYVLDAVEYLEYSKKNLLKCVDILREENLSMSADLENLALEADRMESKLEELSGEEVKKGIEKIITGFKSTFRRRIRANKLTEIKLNEAEENLGSAVSSFKEGLKYLDSKSDSNEFIKQLYRDLKRSHEHPSLVKQINNGIKDSKKALKSISDLLNRADNLYRKGRWINPSFPSDYLDPPSENFHDNLKITENFISSIRREIMQTHANLDKEKVFSELKNLEQNLEQGIKSQFSPPTSNWSKEYLEYPGPGEDPKKDPKDRKVKKYIIYPGEGTVQGVQKKLENVEKQVADLIEIGINADSEKKKTDYFNLENVWKNISSENVDLSGSLDLSRRELYEIFPPKPIMDEPDISVYHRVKIDEISFSREDPLGIVEASSPPTPVHLWFINTTIYWAQWKIQIELEDPPEFEILDYSNQTIPRPLREDSDQYIHKPLPFYQSIDKTEFSFRLIVISLRNFQINHG
ncbi:MAG: hypothetical protein ACOCSH_01225 [Candidatus Hadarchaeota archaeon]